MLVLLLVTEHPKKLRGNGNGVDILDGIFKKINVLGRTLMGTEHPTSVSLEMVPSWVLKFVQSCAQPSFLSVTYHKRPWRSWFQRDVHKRPTR